MRRITGDMGPAAPDARRWIRARPSDLQDGDSNVRGPLHYTSSRQFRFVSSADREDSARVASSDRHAMVAH